MMHFPRSSVKKIWEDRIMELEKLSIEGEWIGRSAVHEDHRGSFRE